MMSFLWPARVRRHKNVSISWHRHGEWWKHGGVFALAPVSKTFSVLSSAKVCHAHPAADKVIPTPAEKQLRLIKRKEREDASSVTAQYPAVRIASCQEHAT